MLKIAICEDMKIDLEELKEKVEKVLWKMNIRHKLHCFTDGNSLLETNIRYDIVFLDIEMSGTSGMDVAKKFFEEEKFSFIIFTTNYDEYFAEGYKVRAFRYLVKPIKEEDIEEAIRQIVKLWSKDRVLFKNYTTTTWYSVLQKDILYVQSANKGRGVRIHTVKDAIEDQRTMKEYDKILSKSRFFRAHKCYFVNMDYIESYNRYFIYLRGGEKVWLSSKKYKLFTQAFDSYKWERGSR